MNKGNLDKIGILADEIDNLIAGLNIPMEPSFHIDMLKKILPEKSKVLKQIFIEETGENPWDDFNINESMKG